MINPYEPKAFKILHKRRFDSCSLLIAQCSLNPMPGQFLQASYLGAGECPISACSNSPKRVDLLIRDVGNVTSKLAQLDRGQSILLRGPYGNGYPLKEMEGKGIIIIASGTGSAPTRSLVQYIDKNRQKFKQVQIYHGFKKPEEIFFRSDFEDWSRKYIANISVDECADPDYRGKVCSVTESLPESISPENAVAVICGSDAVITSAKDRLIKYGFLPSQIYVSLEKHMKCGIGKCGHCVTDGKHICQDGPVFTMDEAGGMHD
jgi:NAD(P)H-flavin reductase